MPSVPATKIVQRGDLSVEIGFRALHSYALSRSESGCPGESASAYNPAVTIEEELAPRVIPRSAHLISRSNISQDCLKVLYRLQKAGYRAYLVGGAVRDLMLGGAPKDFDVATDAEPQQIRKLFRNARIIGRRFRLAHILFRDGIVECSTFRAPPDPDAQEGGPESSLITSDNTFGSASSDAFRRDFTINALFYDVGDFSVLDYVGGVADLEAGLVRVIGEPEVRFHEDPVRMVRACEFAARLDFSIEDGTREGIRRSRRELSKAAAPRMTEELLQLLRTGQAGRAFAWMRELGLLEVFLPELDSLPGSRDEDAGAFGALLAVLDQRAAKRRKLSDAALLGAVLLPRLLRRRFEAERRRRQVMPAARFREVVDATIGGFVPRFALPNHKKARLAQALDGFHRMCVDRWTRERRLRFAQRPTFEDSLALFEVLVDTTGEGWGTLEAWRALHRKPARHRAPPVDRRRSDGGRRRRRGGRRRSG